MQCFSEARRQSFTCMNIYPFYPSCYTALVLAARLLANLTSHTLRWRGLQNYICLLERTERCWKEDSEEFFALSTAWEPCVSVCQAVALIGNTKQATGEKKSSLVET